MWQISCTKIHDFLVVDFSNFWSRIIKKWLPVLKNQNGITIQDGVENVLIYHPIFAKMMFLFVFLWFFFIFWVKNKFSWKNFFLKIQNGGRN
jgi:hypothetical protein